jgi:hypothetical protein
MKGARIRNEQNELETCPVVECVVTVGECLCSGISALVVLIVIITTIISTTTTTTTITTIILLLERCNFLHPSHRMFTKLYSYFNNLLRDNPNSHMQVFANFSLVK